MSTSYTKIRYAVQAAYGTSEYEYMYLVWNSCGDSFSVFDGRMRPIIVFDSWGCGGGEDWLTRFLELVTKIHPDENDTTNHIEYCSDDEEAKLKEAMGW